MKKQILMLAVMFSALAITAHAQGKQQAPAKMKHQTTATAGNAKAKPVTNSKQPTAKQPAKNTKAVGTHAPASK